MILLDRAMLQTGDHVICVAPAYQSLHENATCLNCDVTSWDIEADETGRLHFSVSYSLQLLCSHLKIILPA